MLIYSAHFGGKVPRTAGYDGPGCSKCAVDFARTDSNVFICMKCVAWLLLKRLSWHICCIESMCMSGYEIKRTGRKTVHLALVALNVRTWTQICMHACKRPLWACSGSLWGLLLRPQILFRKWENCWYLWRSMPWSLQSLQFLDSSWWIKMLNRSDRHRLGAAPRQASSERKGATKIATWTWFRIPSMRPEYLTNLNILHQFVPAYIVRN